MDDNNMIKSYNSLLNDIEHLKNRNHTLYTIWKQYLTLKHSEHMKISEQISKLRENTLNNENNEGIINITPQQLQLIYTLFSCNSSNSLFSSNTNNT